MFRKMQIWVQKLDIRAYRWYFVVAKYKTKSEKIKGGEMKLTMPSWTLFERFWFYFLF